MLQQPEQLPDPASPPLLDTSLASSAAPPQADPQGTPQEYGLPLDCPSAERHRWERQELYLRAYAKLGSHHRAKDSTGVNWATQSYWEERNLYGYRERLKAAMQEHRERQEKRIFEALEQAPPRDLILHPVLPIFALKGAWPEKYGDKVQLTDSSGIVAVLKGLQNLGALNQAARQGVAPPSADAQVRELKPGESNI